MRTVDEMKAAFSEREAKLEADARCCDTAARKWLDRAARMRSCDFEVSPEELALLVSETGTFHLAWADTKGHGHKIVAGVQA